MTSGESLPATVPTPREGRRRASHRAKPAERPTEGTKEPRRRATGADEPSRPIQATAESSPTAAREESGLWAAPTEPASRQSVPPEQDDRGSSSAKRGAAAIKRASRRVAPAISPTPLAPEVGRRPRAALTVLVLTGVAFVLGGLLRSYIASAMGETAVAGAPAFWVLLEAALSGDWEPVDLGWPILLWAPILAQGALGFGVLAWALRDRYPAESLWLAGMLGLAIASSVPFFVIGAVFYDQQLLVTIGLFTGLITGAALHIPGAAGKVTLASWIGFGVAFNVMLVIGLLAAYQSTGTVPPLHPLDPFGIAADFDVVNPIGRLITFPGVLAQDFIIGVSLAGGVLWALGPAKLRNGQLVRYVVERPFSPFDVQA